MSWGPTLNKILRTKDALLRYYGGPEGLEKATNRMLKQYRGLLPYRRQEVPADVGKSLADKWALSLPEEFWEYEDMVWGIYESIRNIAGKNYRAGEALTGHANPLLRYLNGLQITERALKGYGSVIGGNEKVTVVNAIIGEVVAKKTYWAIVELEGDTDRFYAFCKVLARELL